MNWQLLWFVLAGLVLGFALSTLWEWFYFRRERMVVRDERITELEAQLRAYEERDREQQMAAPAWTAPGYQSPGVLLESEQAEDLAVSVGADDLVEAPDPLVSYQYPDDDVDTIDRSVDEGMALAGATFVPAAAIAAESDEELADEPVAEDVVDDALSETSPDDEEQDSLSSGKILAGAAVGAAGLAAAAAATGDSEEKAAADSVDVSVEDAAVAAQEESQDSLLPEDPPEEADLPDVEPDEELVDEPVPIDSADDALSETLPDDEEQDSLSSGKILAGAAVGVAGLAAVAAATGDSEGEVADEPEGVPIEDDGAAAQDALPPENLPEEADLPDVEPDEELVDEPIAEDVADGALSETSPDDEEQDSLSSGKVLAGAALGVAGLAAVAAATGDSEEESADVSVEDAAVAAQGGAQDSLLPEDPPEEAGSPDAEPDEELVDEPVAEDVADDALSETSPDDEEQDSLSSGKTLAGAAVGVAGLAAVAAATGDSEDEVADEPEGVPVGDAVVAVEEEPQDVSLSEDLPEEADVPGSEPDEELPDESVAIDGAEDAFSETSPDEEEEDSLSSGKVLAGAALGVAGLAAVAAATGDSEEDAADEDADVPARDAVGAVEEEPQDVVLSEGLPEEANLPDSEPDEELPNESVVVDAGEDALSETSPDHEEQDSLSSGKILAGAAVGVAGLAAATGGSEEDAADEAEGVPVEDAAVAAQEESQGALSPADLRSTEVPVGEPHDSPTDEPQIWLPEDIHGYPDNLLRVKGVGKAYCRRLFEAGIFTWDQLSQMSVDEISEIAHPFVSADVEKWPERARVLAERNDRVGARYIGPAPDDLSEIRGIGTNTMQRLFKGGIWSFSQLATSSPEELKEIIPTSPSGENINYEYWIECAAEKAQESD